jgi:outer membrane lipoprotein-sorting protein
MKKTRMIGLGILVAVSLVLTGCQSGPTAEEIVGKMKDVEASTVDAHAVVEFGLQAQGTDMEVVVELWEKKPNKLRVEVLEASDADLVGATSVSDGQRVWMYHPGENEVMTGELAELGEEGRQLFNPRQAIEVMEEAIQWVLDSCEAKLIGEEELEGTATYKLEFVPKKGEGLNVPIPLGGKVTLWVEKERWIVLQAELAGAALGQGRTHVRSFEFNTGVPDDRFRFDIPEGAQVTQVEERGPVPLTLDEARAQAEFPLLVPSYVPQGATLIEIVSVGEAHVLRYDHAAVSFAIVQGPSSASGELFELPAAMPFGSREVTVRGHDATLIVDEAQGNSLLIWTEGDLTFRIAGSISQDEVLKVAESLQ